MSVLHAYYHVHLSLVEVVGSQQYYGHQYSTLSVPEPISPFHKVIEIQLCIHRQMLTYPIE